MKTTMLRIVTLGAICACFIGVAFAQHHGDRDLHAQMDRLQTAKRAARAHHNRAQVHYLQSLINRLQARMDHQR